MATNETPEDAIHELRRKVDGLARQIVLDDAETWDTPSADMDAARIESVAETLRVISATAREAGRPAVADIAGELLENLGEAAGETALVKGMERLQRALEPAEPRPGQGLDAAAATCELGQDPELLSEFILEAREHLTNIENQLLTLEQDPYNHDSLHAVFRGFHTIKGLAGFLDMATIQEVAHEVETVLDLARNGQLTISSEVADVVLAGADFLNAAIRNVENSFRGRPVVALQDSGDLIRRVRAIAECDSTAPPGTECTPAKDSPATAEDAAASSAGGARKRPPGSQNGHAQAVKVNTGKLDYLVDMVGELVVAQSLLRHDPHLDQIRSQRFQRNLSQLARITTDVQRTAMSMRMVPVGTLFRRMARLVRDLSRKENKQVELTTAGDDTELDRNIVEQLADPLMHMVRNAIGHGLESPEERTVAGKPPTGQIRLSAYHQSDFIIIELGDDGRGLNRAKILAKARERGLVASGYDLSDHEAQGLIFEPGFSTASVVNGVSGRGVGMDVVKRNILKLRGRVDISSKEGGGTTFSLRLPLTLAIIDGLIVGVGEQRYVVPIYTVHEMLRPSPDAMSTLQNRDEMVMVRGRLLPVVRLYRRFGITPKSEDPAESLLLVTENLGQRFCLMVDELIGKQEVVIKSLGEALKGVPGIAGGAILGDGQVGLILDMDGLFGAVSRG